MTVQELIDELQQLPPDLKVVMSQDPEGNGFSSFSGDLTAGYAEDPDDWDLEWTAEGDWEENGHDEPYPGDNIVVLWP